MELKFQVYRVMAHLQNREAYDKYDLASELKMHPRTAARHLKELWALDIIYICDWEKEHQSFHPVYRWGNRPDVERPAAETNDKANAIAKGLRVSDSSQPVSL